MSGGGYWLIYIRVRWRSTVRHIAITGQGTTSPEGGMQYHWSRDSAPHHFTHVRSETRLLTWRLLIHVLVALTVGSCVSVKRQDTNFAAMQSMRLQLKLCE
ncbi:hypothetical protein AVEN_203627-1 [Araneus ventricosus]|uniref:Uncharacterized protein n=1 Tax=Araneus ventricosus TaxID=182803 RepID=A0A4Y2BDP6_ARAVE|nr:hypothetical protein AVEN_203627-1 [Araneus ventricosus]